MKLLVVFIVFAIIETIIEYGNKAVIYYFGKGENK